MFRVRCHSNYLMIITQKICALSYVKKKIILIHVGPQSVEELCVQSIMRKSVNGFARKRSSHFLQAKLSLFECRASRFQVRPPESGML